MRIGLALLTLGLSSVLAHAEAPITITINPEARISVSRSGELPPRIACAGATTLEIRIVNQGFVTAPLQATLVDSIPEGAVIEFSAEPLRGAREERRMLHLTLEKPGQADVTIAFRAKNDIPDLGGRDRIHLLLQCRSAPQQFMKGVLP